MSFCASKNAFALRRRFASSYYFGVVFTSPFKTFFFSIDSREVDFVQSVGIPATADQIPSTALDRLTDEPILQLPAQICRKRLIDDADHALPLTCLCERLHLHGRNEAKPEPEVRIRDAIAHLPHLAFAKKRAHPRNDAEKLFESFDVGGNVLRNVVLDFAALGCAARCLLLYLEINGRRDAKFVCEEQIAFRPKPAPLG